MRDLSSFLFLFKKNLSHETKQKSIYQIFKELVNFTDLYKSASFLNQQIR